MKRPRRFSSPDFLGGVGPTLSGVGEPDLRILFLATGAGSPHGLANSHGGPHGLASSHGGAHGLTSTVEGGG